MILSTTHNIEGQKIKKYLDIVTGTDIYLVGGMLGGGMVNQEKLYGYSFSKAVGFMKSKARTLGANADVGISSTITSPGNANNMIVVVTGTAVIIEESEEDNDENEIPEL